MKIHGSPHHTHASSGSSYNSYEGMTMHFHAVNELLSVKYCLTFDENYKSKENPHPKYGLIENGQVTVLCYIIE